MTMPSALELEIAPALDISVIHTLGPEGTNCEYAAREWLRRQGRSGFVHLHPTLENAADALRAGGEGGLLGCVVYPLLHRLTFRNRDWLELVDCFVLPTLPMVLATRAGIREPASIVSHPAPADLCPDEIADRRVATSNAASAEQCAAGAADACITTLAAARATGLVVRRNFGTIPMGFTLHAPRTEEP
jgi:prephenate dehydratase